MTVGWDRSGAVTAWRGLDPLRGDGTADLVVVGLGASGLAAVRWAADAGLTVVGIDAGRVAAGAAGRNAGFLLGGLARFHHEVVARIGAAAAVATHRATLSELDRLSAELGELVERRGSLRLAGPPGPARSAAAEAERAREVADCRVHLAALSAAGIAASWYEGPLGTGVAIADDGALDPAARCLTEAARLTGRAALHEHTPALAIIGGHRPEVRTPRGTIVADAVAVCVDGGLERCVPQLAGRVRTARLQMLATQPLPRILDRPVYLRRGLDYAQQRPDGRLFVGGGRDVGGNAEWTGDTDVTEPVQAWIEEVASSLAGGSVDVADRWAASAGFSAAGLPVCELVDEHVAAAGGYDGTGNLVGPICARAAAAAALADADPSPELPWSAEDAQGGAPVAPPDG